MADPPPPPPSSGNGSHSSSAAAAAAETLSLTLPSSSAATTTNSGGKRQRRPSVRLGDPGEQPASVISSLIKPHFNSSWRSSKTPHVTNFNQNNSSDDNNPLAAASAFRRGPRDSKVKKPKRARSNWPLSSHPIDEDNNRSPSPPHPDGEQPVSEWNGLDSNNGDEELHVNGRIRSQRQVSQPLDRLDEEEGEEEEDNDELIGGVRSWLNQLGLGRYALVFEIHEVDEEVLPMLTLEDLKDMGINAVGSRRKMFYAIQKLRKSLP